MRTKWTAKWILSPLLFSTYVFSAAVPSHATLKVLPDACGSDAVKFSVKTDKDAPAPGDPAGGMAQVVFVQTPELGNCIGCSTTTRIGMDGSWLGANHGKSYFAVAIAPGEHHLCASLQAKIGPLGKLVAMTSFTAEAGKTYYFKLEPEDHNRTLPLPPNTPPNPDWRLNFGSMSEDEGKYGVKTSPQSKGVPSGKS